MNEALTEIARLRAESSMRGWMLIALCATFAFRLPADNWFGVALTLGAGVLIVWSLFAAALATVRLLRMPNRC